MPSNLPGLESLLRPKSITIVGVSREPGRQQTLNGSTILDSLQRFEYPGRIDLVHPSGEEIAGRRSAASIDALPESSDAIVLALPAAAVPEIVANAGKRGIRGAVILSAGFAELGNEEGLRLGRQLEETAAAHGVRICGPNGLGYINVWDRVLAGYFPCLGSDALPRPGGLSIVTQSGAVGNSLLARAMDRQIGMSFVISSGNEVNVSVADYIDFLVDDPHTKVIAVYLEGIENGSRLREALLHSTTSGKPVVVYKVGKSVFGARAAFSHTAKVAGEPALYTGMFRQLGVAEAHRLDELIEFPMLWLKAGRLDGKPPRRIGVVSISGGLGAIVADHFAAEGFELPELSGATRSRLDALPVKLGSTANPVDMTAAIQRTESTISEILEIVAQDDAVDAIVFPNASRFPAPALNVARIMASAAECFDKPLMSIWYAGADNDAAMSALHASKRVACFDDPSASARALAALRDFQRFMARPAEAHVQAPRDTAGLATRLQGPRILNEAEGKAILKAYGIAVPREVLVDGAAQAADAALELGLPVAMKIVSADVPHKAKVGGVRLGLAARDEVLRAHEQMFEQVKANVPEARIDGVLISEMLAVKLELLVGAFRDVHFGLVMVVGIGGSRVEEAPDISIRLLPVNAGDCRNALDQLQDRRVRLLEESEKTTLAAAIARVAAMAWDLRTVVVELDVNPIALTFRGDAVALDAFLTLSSEMEP